MTHLVRWCGKDVNMKCIVGSASEKHLISSLDAFAKKMFNASRYKEDIKSKKYFYSFSYSTSNDDSYSVIATPIYNVIGTEFMLDTWEDVN